MNRHEAIYTLYHSACQTKMSANVHYIPIHQTYCMPNILCVWYTHFSLSVAILLTYLSITMYFNQSQYGVTSFAAYSVTACFTLMASISMHFDWLI